MNPEREQCLTGIAQQITLAQLPDPDPPSARRRGMLFDTLTVSCFATLAKLMGAAKAVVLARAFGSAAALDSYLLAFLLPSFLADVFCGSLIPVLVPKLVEFEYREGHAKAVDLYGHVLRRSVWLSCSAAVALAAGAAIVATLGGGGGGVRLNLHLLGVLTLLMTPLLPLSAVANVWRAVLNAHRSFVVPALTVALTPAVIILCIQLAGRSRGVWILAAGTSLSGLAEVVVLGFGLRRTGFPILPQRREGDFSLLEFRKEYGYLAAVTAMSAASAFLGQSMAAALGAGSVSILNYGTRLAGVLMAIGPAALSVTILPQFSHMVATRDLERLKQSLWRILAASVLVASAVAGLLIVFSIPIVRLTLQRGAFTATDTQVVASVQSYSLLQLPFIVGITILMRILSALKANRALLPFASAAVVLNTVLNYALMTRYGVPGIALATSLAQALLFAALATLVFRRGPRGFLRDCDADSARRQFN
jgi:putative peptidoglycan lipid II flippase